MTPGCNGEKVAASTESSSIPARSQRLLYMLGELNEKGLETNLVGLQGGEVATGRRVFCCCEQVTLGEENFLSEINEST